MKLLDFPTLAGLRTCMSGGSTASDSLLDVHLAVYSMKNTSEENTDFKKFNDAFKQSTALHRSRAQSISSIADDNRSYSPPRNVLDIAFDEPITDVQPPLDVKHSQMDVKTMWLLISVLNTNFPDFDFSCVAIQHSPGYHFFSYLLPSSPPPPH